MKKPALSWILLLQGLALVCCKQKPAAPPATVPVNLVSVRPRPVVYYDLYPGTTVALSQVDIRPQVQGYITGLYFVEGTHIHKGQKLYEIDERLFLAAYNQAQANVRVAEGNLMQAQQDADRYVYLNTHNAVARQTLDHSIIALQNAKNELNAAEQAVKTAATNLTYSVINAPFDGTIGFSQVKLGNLVTVGQTVLNTISTDDPMATDFLIGESQLAKYEGLQRYKQQEQDSLFTIVLPDRSTYPYPGKISVIDRAVDPQTGTVRIRLVFPNFKHDLRAGMSCVVRVRNQDNRPQIVIPGRAVIEQMGEFFVFLAKDTLVQDSSGKERPRLIATQVRVVTGQTIDSIVLIKSGIREGDRVVVDGVQALHAGSFISPAFRAPGGAGMTRGPAAGVRPQ
jgi:membrane fusion protein (multidrug efflux system)